MAGVNRTYEEMARITVWPWCRHGQAKPRDKAKAEAGVQVVGADSGGPAETEAFSLAELNQAIADCSRG
jgi:hypothetical protein